MRADRMSAPAGGFKPRGPMFTLSSVFAPSQRSLTRTATHGLRRAFTVMEMLIVVTLVAIVTAMVMPKVNYTAYRVDAGARGIRVALQRAQTFAVSSQHNMLVAIDVPNSQLFVVEDVNNNLAVDPGERVTNVPLQDGVIFSVPGTSWAGAPTPTGELTGATLTTITVNGTSLPGFVFRCDGAASSDAQIYLSSKRGVLTDFRGVNVTQATGRVDWYKDLGATWAMAGF
jgi:prepilin-type N-terminal cleavage/methylation domain-containing protein